MHSHDPSDSHIVMSQGRPFCTKCADFLQSVPQHLVPEFIKEKYKSNKNESEVKKKNEE